VGGKHERRATKSPLPEPVLRGTSGYDGVPEAIIARAVNVFAHDKRVFTDYLLGGGLRCWPRVTPWAAWT